jgi:RNA polymerase sigma factor (sigma-70 family)
MDDWKLLLEWIEHGSDEAFGAIVERHLNLVYSVARRSVPTTAQAEELTQTVFIILARKAAGLSRRTAIGGWLYRTTRFTAMEMLRRENRQQARREAFAKMETSEPNLLWEQVAPVLEEALDQIHQRDRDALVLRFMEERSLRDVGQTLGISEDAARKRVDRGLEKLRALLTRRGISTTATLLSVALTTNAVQCAPTGLVHVVTAGITDPALATSTSTLVKGTFQLMASAKLKTMTVATAALLLALGTVTVITMSTMGLFRPSRQVTPAVTALTGKWQLDGSKETMEFHSDGTCQGSDRYGRRMSGKFTFIESDRIRIELTTRSVDKASGTVGVDKAAGICKLVVNNDSLTMTDEGGSAMHYRRVK